MIKILINIGRRGEGGMLEGSKESLSAGTEKVRHYQSSLLAATGWSVEAGADLHSTPQTGGAQDVGGGQAGLPLQQGVEAEDAVGGGVDGDSLYAVDSDGEGESAGSLEFDCLLLGLNLHLERAGVPVSGQDVLQLLLVSLQGGHLLL